MKKTTKIILLIVLVFILCIGGFVGYKGFKFFQDKYHFLRESLVEINEKLDNHILSTTHYDFDYSWVESQKTVCHGLGALGSSKSKTYSNSLDAFKTNYELGQRIFEVDFDITEDLVTVCNHDEAFWRQNANISDDVAFTHDNFMNSLIYEKYEPLDYAGIINLLNECKDAYIITDTKYLDKDKIYLQFSQLVNYAKKIDPSILDRIVPQIYNEEMLSYVMNIYPFKSIVYTLYQTEWTAEGVAEFCNETGIKYVTVASEYLEKHEANLWNAYGINIAVHTINDLDEANDFINNYGVKMIYTDELLPSQFEETVDASTSNRG